ncbi:hypothetical protein GCM10010294_33170 [Streptomyces griseoloalbus]|nr:hypothetical protein GCM10010294_33170 [Streptomyces griseoloalbus]
MFGVPYTHAPGPAGGDHVPAGVEAEAPCPGRREQIGAPPHRPALQLRLDPQRIRQVLDNLLTNAAVHTPAGTRVSVEVTVAGDAALVRVADAGPGVPAEDRERVFDRFHRVDKARSRDRGGSGLGLAVARSLVRAHGGGIALSSEPGSTVFTVRLPLDGGPAPEHPGC